MPTLESQDKVEIQKAVGKTASPLYSTIAKLYLCNENETEWRDTERWGALTLIIDRTPPISIHIKILALGTFECLFTQEIDAAVANSYTAPSKQFHTFNAPHAIIGLSFTDEAEAEEFYNKFISSKSLLKANTATASSPTAARPRKKSGFFSKMINSIFTKDTPMEIGRPTSVVHKQHIGYDPDKGFETSDIPPEWTSIFKNAGIRKQDLKNPDAARIIFDTLQSIDMSSSTPTSPHPIGNIPNAPISTPDDAPVAPAMDNIPPPPPPMEDSSAPLPPLPPIPASDISVSAPRPPPKISTSTLGPVPPAPLLGAGAPPPPPGPPSSLAATQPLPPASPVSPKSPTKCGVANSRDDLLSAIQHGVSLKKVNAAAAASAAPSKQSALPDATRLNSLQAQGIAEILKRRVDAIRIATVEDDDGDDGWD